MIIRSKEKSTINGETKPMYVHDTDALAVTVNKWKANDQEYLNTVAAVDMDKANGLENMLRLCAREPFLRLWDMYNFQTVVLLNATLSLLYMCRVDKFSSI